MNQTEMIYGLSKLYSEVKYNYGMFNRVKIDLDKEYKVSLCKIMEVDNIFDYYKELKRFITILNDPHSYVVMPEQLIKDGTIGILPIDIINIDDEWYINLYTKDYQGELEAYCKIIEINGRDTRQYFNDFVFPYSSHKSYKDTLAIKNEFLLGKINDNLEITVEFTDGSLKSINLERIKVGANVEWVSYKKTKSYSNKAESLYYSGENCFEILKYKDLGILSIWSFNCPNMVKDIIKNIDLLSNKKNILLDLRKNNGGSGSNALELLSIMTNEKHFLSKDKHRTHNSYYKARAYFKIKYESLKTYDEYLLKYGEKSDKNFKRYYRNYYNQDHDETTVKRYLSSDCEVTLTQPITLLIGRKTASAAEAFIEGFKSINRGVIIGERTLGAGGQPLMVDLPYGGIAAICTEDTTLIDGTQFNNNGFIPNILAEYSIEDYLAPTLDDKEFEICVNLFYP